MQRDMGRFQAIKYFIDIKEQTLPWAEVLFHDGKVDSDSLNADRMEYLCPHLVIIYDDIVILFQLNPKIL